jgi:hypothetical protein
MLQFLIADGLFSGQAIQPSQKNQLQLGSVFSAGFEQAFDKTAANMAPDPIGAGMQADRSENVEIRPGEGIFPKTVQNMCFSASGFTVEECRGAVTLAADRIHGFTAYAESV